ncbi:MAG: hypothetical protein CL484_03145 [Acidobacteria bacterium]|nr:hypothetical protein [Acidobacteriota bacterium]|tara:strand:- start:447 stop:839 length:393 start_codon:yes stop_codon:yes gene_type:complete
MPDKPNLEDLFDLGASKNYALHDPRKYDEYQRECQQLFADFFCDKMQPLLKKHEATIRHFDILQCVMIYGLFRTTLIQTDPEVEDERFTVPNYESAIIDFASVIGTVMARVEAEHKQNIERIQREAKGKS